MKKTSICPGFSLKPGQMGSFLSRFVTETGTNGGVLIYTDQQPPPKTIGGIFFLKWKEGVCASLFFLYACKVFDEMPERVHELI